MNDVRCRNIQIKQFENDSFKMYATESTSLRASHERAKGRPARRLMARLTYERADPFARSARATFSSLGSLPSLSIMDRMPVPCVSSLSAMP